MSAKQRLAVDLTEFLSHPFKPASGLSNGHLMTIAPLLMGRRFPLTRSTAQECLIEVDKDVFITGYLHNPAKSLSTNLLIIVHGLESSAQATYVQGLCEKSLDSGLSVFRMNMRNCEGRLDLASGLYNAGLSQDLCRVAEYLKQTTNAQRVFACGFSLGGNIVLKAAAELGLLGSDLLSGVVAISPPIDLDLSVQAIESGINKLYEHNFLYSLKQKIRDKARLFPDVYDIGPLSQIQSLRQFDDRYTSIDAGYKCAAEYYAGASARPMLKQIDIPTLIIAAHDDPLVPFESFDGISEVETKGSGACVQLLAPRHGGHVSFVSANQLSINDLGCTGVATVRDNYWAEWKALDFVLKIINCQ
ncbi:MAG: alpha/beta fold hydrolase [Candidatus Obscuribacter sp.]|nr:alpha/beta fold hydrolase [Candidatus Obscuribacter sp.]